MDELNSENYLYSTSKLCLALDCEMVGVDTGDVHMLARVSIVDRDGSCIYDKYVKPQKEVVDYRTPISGIRPEHLSTGEAYHKVEQDVKNILNGCILVGHALHHDLQVLNLKHPKHMIRDTSLYKPFRKISGGKTPSLKLLAKEVLNKSIQIGEHSSIEDAFTAMQIYLRYQEKWEKSCRSRRYR